MSRTAHHTQSLAAVQAPPSSSALTDDWHDTILPRLPDTLDQQARSLKAFRRSRAFSCPSDLLRGLLVYALKQFSFRKLGAWALLTDLADISHKSWRQRLISASPWLDWLLGDLLATQHAPRLLSQRVRGRLLLIDATMLARPAGGGAGWRVHCAYDLLAGRLAQVQVTNHYGAESLSYYDLKPGDLIVADGAYATRAAFGRVKAAGADLLTRIHLNSFPLEQADGSRFDALAWLKQPGPLKRSCVAWITTTHTRNNRQIVSRHRVRVVAERLAAAQRASAERQLRRKASKHGRQVTERGLFLTSWTLLVTTLSEDEWSDEELRELYRARWQVELLFKRLKQMLKVHSLRCKDEQVATATILALMVGWVVVEQEVEQVKAEVERTGQTQQEEPGQAREEVVSVWSVSEMVVESVQQAVLGGWNLGRLRECLGRLRRYVVSHKRQRGHQASEVLRLVRGLRETPTTRASRRAA